MTDLDLYFGDEVLIRVFRGELEPTPERVFLDGPQLAEWIRGHYDDLTAQLGKDLKRVQMWEKGSPAELGTADRILTQLGGHLIELPPEVWIDKPPRKARTKRRPPKAMAA